MHAKNFVTRPTSQRHFTPLSMPCSCGLLRVLQQAAMVPHLIYLRLRLKAYMYNVSCPLLISFPLSLYHVILQVCVYIAKCIPCT